MKLNKSYRARWYQKLPLYLLSLTTFSLSACQAQTPAQAAKDLGLTGTSHLVGVNFIDAQHGWAVGHKGVILATEDGGAHWKKQKSPTEKDLNAVHFTDLQHGFAVGETGIVIVTNDGGHNWKSQKAIVDADLENIYFFDTRHAWITGRATTVLVTTDAAEHWQLQMTDGSSLKGIGGIHFFDLQRGLAVGAGALWSTPDSGKHWNRQDSPIDEPLQTLAFADTQHGWAISSDGSIIATQDGGVHWVVQHRTVNYYLRDVQFLDSNHGWIVGGDGIIITTVDGGNHWKEKINDTHLFFSGVSFVDLQHGWIVGDAGTVLATGDGGNTWHVQLSAAPPPEQSDEKAKSKPAMGTRLDLGIVGYNYTNHYIDQFSVDGAGGGNVDVSSETSGGGISCCVPYISGAAARKVHVRWSTGACTYDHRTYSQGDTANSIHHFFKEEVVQVNSKIPDRPNYLEVHIYPDGHAEAAMTEELSPPRLSLNKDREIRQEYPRCPNDTEPTE